MSKRTGDPLGGDLEEDTRGDPLGGSAEKDTRDPIGDVAEDTRGDPLGDFAHETPKEPVGYCNPPRQFTWKKGQSANPKGRKKGSKNESTILRELMNRKIKVREGKRVRTVTILEALHTNFVEDALKAKNTALPGDGARPRWCDVEGLDSTVRCLAGVGRDRTHAWSLRRYRRLVRLTQACPPAGGNEETWCGPLRSTGYKVTRRKVAKDAGRPRECDFVETVRENNRAKTEVYEPCRP